MVERGLILDDSLQFIFILVSAGLLFIVAIIIGVSIFRHMKSYTVPHIQNKMIFILSACLWYQACFFLSIVFYKYYDYIQLTLEIYLCAALAIFYEGMMKLLIAEKIKSLYFKPEEIMKISIEDREVARGIHEDSRVYKKEIREKCIIIAIKKIESIPHFMPINWFLNPLQITTWRGAKIYLGIQNTIVRSFILLMPASIMLMIALNDAHEIELQYLYLSINVAKFIGVTIVMYAIVLFTHGMEPYLKKHQPIRKFLALKVIVSFLTFQNIVINSVNPTSPHLNSTDMTVVINNFLLSCENFILAFVYAKYYSATQFKFGALALTNEDINYLRLTHFTISGSDRNLMQRIEEPDEIFK